MLICPKCGHENPHSRITCTQCGETLPNIPNPRISKSSRYLSDTPSSYSYSSDFTIEEVKGNAKYTMRRSFFKSFFVLVVFVIISFLITWPSSLTRTQMERAWWSYQIQPYLEYLDKTLAYLDNFEVGMDRPEPPAPPSSEDTSFLNWITTDGINYIIALGGALLLAFLLNLFFARPLEVGMKRHFLRAAEGDIKFYLFSPFKKGQYGKVFKACLARDFVLFLWSLLVFIPLAAAGLLWFIFDEVMFLHIAWLSIPLLVLFIAKSISYMMVSYIISENPYLTAFKAVRQSSKIMKGNKRMAFILWLSFLGWIILAIVVAFLLALIPFAGGVLVYLPVLLLSIYMYSAEAEFYKAAIDSYTENPTKAVPTVAAE